MQTQVQMKKSGNQRGTKIYGYPASWVSAFAYLGALALGCAAYANGKNVGETACQGTTPADFFFPLGLGALILAIAGIVIADTRAKKLEPIGFVVLLVTLGLAVFGFISAVHICV